MQKVAAVDNKDYDAFYCVRITDSSQAYTDLASLFWNGCPEMGKTSNSVKNERMNYLSLHYVTYFFKDLYHDIIITHSVI